MLAEQSSVFAGISRLLCRRLAQNNRALQTAKSNHQQMVSTMLEKLPEILRQLLSAASMLPLPSINFLNNYFAVPNIADLISDHASTLELDPIHDIIKIDPALRHILQQFYLEAVDPGAKQLLIEAAALNYLKNDKLQRAVELYTENSLWQDACDLVRQELQEPSVTLLRQS